MKTWIAAIAFGTASVLTGVYFGSGKNIEAPAAIASGQVAELPRTPSVEAGVASVVDVIDLTSLLEPAREIPTSGDSVAFADALNEIAVQGPTHVTEVVQPAIPAATEFEE